eukprot:1590473-Pyramimonas_sp.AAC.1
MGSGACELSLFPHTFDPGTRGTHVCLPFTNCHSPARPTARAHTTTWMLRATVWMVRATMGMLRATVWM